MKGGPCEASPGNRRAGRGEPVEPVQHHQVAGGRRGAASGPGPGSPRLVLRSSAESLARTPELSRRTLWKVSSFGEAFGTFTFNRLSPKGAVGSVGGQGPGAPRGA